MRMALIIHPYPKFAKLSLTDSTGMIGISNMEQMLGFMLTKRYTQHHHCSLPFFLI